MYLFPLYIPGNRFKHPSECNILKVLLKIVLGGHAPEPVIPAVNPHTCVVESRSRYSLKPFDQLTQHFARGNTADVTATLTNIGNTP